MDMDGVQVAGGWLHSGEVDWEANVWVVERLNHRILKFNPTLDRALMQLGTTGEPGTDETHLNSPSGILFTRAGNIVVTDGYGNNRVTLFSPDGTFIKQVGRGAGGPDDKGRGPGEQHVGPSRRVVEAWHGSSERCTVAQRRRSVKQRLEMALGRGSHAGDQDQIAQGVPLRLPAAETAFVFLDHRAEHRCDQTRGTKRGGQRDRAELQHEAGVQDVLTRGAPVDVARRIGVDRGDTRGQVADHGDDDVAGVDRVGGDDRAIV